MAIAITIQNRQHTKRVNVARLKQSARALFAKHLPPPPRRSRGAKSQTKTEKELAVELGIALVGDAEMTRLNEHYLQHAGATDVITFDHSEPGTPKSKLGAVHLHGELFICVDEALRQAKRFRTSWQMEILRYLVHGGLHLLGHDDQHPAARRKMKRAENRLVATLAGEFHWARK